MEVRKRWGGRGGKDGEIVTMANYSIGWNII